MTRTTKEQFIDFAGDEPEERDWGAAGAIPPVPERVPADIWENTIRTMGVRYACEWFGYRADDEFTIDTIKVLRERSEEAQSKESP